MSGTTTNLGARSSAWLLCALAACSSTTKSEDSQAASMDAGTKPIASSDGGPKATGAGPVTTDAHATTDAGTANADGYVIYPVNGECPARSFPEGLAVHPTRVCSGRTGECHDEVCHSGADCMDRAFGRCAGFFYDAGAIEFTRCMYEDCQSNDDCAAGSLCVCGKGFRTCVPAACVTDDDCPAGGQCVRADACGQGPGGPFLCTSAADECRTNQDCGARGNSCAAKDGHLRCIRIICD